ncbi:MAG TPA: PadR family transcriptional regulator [Coleofasciculaceae cyanobacterium]|jgi:DNA-binding PadR family transcriptional regulator
MAIAHAILVSLIDSPASGYDLAKQFEASVGFFWKATHQQIYRELTKLEEQGWISAEVVAQENRPDKKLYSVTELGKQQLVDWMTQKSEPTAIKDDLLVKTFAGYLICEQTIIEELEHHRKLHQEKLRVYQDIEQQYFQNPQALSQQAKFRYLTLRKGIGYEQDWIAWCDEAIKLLNQP